jgi:hypothetical protein
MLSLLLLASLSASVSGKVYFQEDFNDADWEKRWTVPTAWKDEVRRRSNLFIRGLFKMNMP